MARHPDQISQALAKARLGPGKITGFILGGVAVLTVSAGFIPTAYAVTGVVSVPLMFGVVAVFLALFSVGFVAMAQRIPNAGAFYAFISRGLGAPVGVASSLVALLAYNLMQVGLYGMFGPTAHDLALTNLGVDLPWWAWSLLAWLAVMCLGMLPVDLAGRVMAVFIGLEVVVTVVLAVMGGLHPAGGQHGGAGFSLHGLTWSAFAVGWVIVTVGFIGFETGAGYSEEARDRGATVRLATYLSLAGMAVLYILVSWALLAFYGPDKIGTLTPDSLFQMGSGPLRASGHVLFLTSLFAAMVSFHYVVSRYMYALGRERVLPGWLSRTSRAGVTRAASMAQSMIGLVAIVLAASGGVDPITQLFFWSGTTGAFGILILLTLASLAVIVFFARHSHGEGLFTRVVAPVISALTLGSVVVLVVHYYPTLLGVPGTHPATWLLPASYLVPAAVGLILALYLKASRLDVYQGIGYAGAPTVQRDGAPVVSTAAVKSFL